ncbi:MAG: hypothetical protein F4X64_06135 [Chloroflexi bacterium]|nr:hypothetical protein [Chloroflexota bacterium]
MTIAPDLPAPGVQSTEDRRQISRRFIIHAREELAKNNRLQAGEKAWGAVVQPLKAIAELRGWQHQSHRDVYAVALQVAQEYSFDVYQVNALADAYRVGHENFYENYRSLDELADMIDRVETLVPYLNRLTDVPPRQVRIASNAQLRNLRQITGNNNLRIGDTSPVGFSRNHPAPDSDNGSTSSDHPDENDAI